MRCVDKQEFLNPCTKSECGYNSVLMVSILFFSFPCSSVGMQVVTLSVTERRVLKGYQIKQAAPSYSINFMWVLIMLKSSQRINIMTNSENMVLDQALGLSAAERANIAEKLLFSLDTPDSKIDALWAKEADSRVEAYKKGEIGAISAEEVFAKYRTT